MGPSQPPEAGPCTDDTCTTTQTASGSGAATLQQTVATLGALGDFLDAHAVYHQLCKVDFCLLTLGDRVPCHWLDALVPALDYRCADLSPLAEMVQEGAVLETWPPDLKAFVRQAFDLRLTGNGTRGTCEALHCHPVFSIFFVS